MVLEQESAIGMTGHRISATFRGPQMWPSDARGRTDPLRVSESLPGTTVSGYK